MIEPALKRAWHRDLASDPVTHGWVLNLYRAGEHHPETVDDYFPHAHAPTPGLAAALRRHAADERKHTALYTRAIQHLGQPVVDLPDPDVFNHAIRAQTPVGWAISADDPPDVVRVRLAHFLAHAHHLEARVARSLDYHLDACAEAGRHAVAEVVATVHADEVRHAAYTREAVLDLLPAAEARDVLALHGRAVARADRAFSARQVRTFVRRFGHLVPRRRRVLWSACAVALGAGVA